jgi:hypothetical protein
MTVCDCQDQNPVRLDTIDHAERIASKEISACPVSEKGPGIREVGDG